MLNFFKLSLFICLFTFLSIFAAAQSKNNNQATTPLQVISAMAPQYPTAASALGIKGEIIVEVNINEKGEVIVTKVISGKERLHEASAKAAKNWKFSALSSGDNKERTARITFNFSILFDTTQRSRETVVIFKPPYVIDIVLNPGIYDNSKNSDAQNQNRWRLNSSGKSRKRT